MRYRMIAFDWDGTIMDSTGLIAQCVREAATSVGLVPPTTSAAKSVIGMGLLPALETLFPTIETEQRDQFARRFREIYVPRDHEAPLYDGIRELLQSLVADDRFLVVATGKPRVGLERSFAYSGLKPFFQYSRCGDEGFSKPHPEMLQQLMKFCGVEPAETLMIGDTTHDLSMAQAAGTDAVAVTYGAHPRGILQTVSARAYADTVGELRQWLESAL